MNELIAEFIGTFLLIVLGNGVVANVVLPGTKGHNGGWLLISIGWGLAVFIAVVVAGPVSGAHINPAVSIGLAAAGLFKWSLVLPYILSQILGAMTGAGLVWLFYFDHFRKSEDPEAMLACFSTIPAIRKPISNFFSEAIGTFILVFVILYIAEPSIEFGTSQVTNIGLGSIGALPVALLVTVIGISLGGTTGYAINPARDFGPRLAHFILPIKGKAGSDWSYAWIPFFGPITGGIVAAAFFLIHNHFIS